ncbi:MAG: hypothetical protein ABJI62_03725, partial [Alphaproteobacteria bacterium]
MLNHAARRDGLVRPRTRALTTVAALAAAGILAVFPTDLSQAQTPVPGAPALTAPSVTAPNVEAPKVTAPDAGTPSSAESELQKEITKAFKKSGLFKGLDLDRLGQDGKARTLKLSGNKGELEFFHLSEGAKDDDTVPSATTPDGQTPPQT